MKLTMAHGVRLNETCQKLSSKSLPIKTSYKLAKALLKLEQEINFYKNQYILLLKNYGEVDADGNFVTGAGDSIKIKEGLEEECSKKIFELDSLEFDFPDFELSLDDLEGIELSAAEVAILVPFIKE